MRALSQQEFLKTPAGVDARLELQNMVKSSIYHTNEGYNPQVDRQLIFIDRHLNYLAKHPQVSPAAYLSNLRVMTKINR